MDETNARIRTRTREHYTDRNSAVFRHGEIAKHAWMIPISTFWFVGMEDIRTEK